MVQLRSRGPDGDPLLDIADVHVFNELLLVEAEDQRRAAKKARQQEGKGA